MYNVLLENDMDMQKIIEKIQDYFQNEMNISEITSETDLVQENLIDSLQVMKLLGFLEDEFDIEVDLESINAKNFTTIVTIAELVRQLKGLSR